MRLRQVMLRLRRLARPRIVRAVVAIVVVALFASVAIVAEGFDVKQTPVSDSGVWALQAGTSDRYARVDTSLRELDTVKTVDSPSGLVQTSSSVLMLAANNTKVASVSQSAPTNLGAQSAALKATPSGTQRVVSTGDYIGYLTTDGRVYVASVGGGAVASPVPVDPYASAPASKKTRRVYASDTIAIGTDGILYSYSRVDRAVLRFDIVHGKILGSVAVPGGPTTAGSTITAVGDSWALLDAAGDELFTAAGRVATGVVGGATLQQPSATGTAVYLATDNALLSVPTTGGKAHTVLGGGADFGVPAAPTALRGVMYAGWVSRGSTSGTFWNSLTGKHTLSYGGKTLSADPKPEFRGNGDRMILNDDESGWVWTAPNGALVPTSQDWSLTTAVEQTDADNTKQATEVTDPKPPIAVNDHFGVRAGALVSLPVILNDHDPNKDVLTVVPSSISATGWARGAVSATNNNQDASVAVPLSASGSATFTYTDTDGTSKNGLLSQPATVTLTVDPSGTETAPQWCGDLQPVACTRVWPTVSVQPGGTSVTPILDGWIDAEGDPMYIQSVRKQNETDPGSVTATADGSVVYQNPNPNGSAATIPVIVTIADSRGKTTSKVLTVDVTPTPDLTATPFALTTTPSTTIQVDPSTHLAGVSGDYQLTSASTGSADGSTIAMNQGKTAFNFSAKTDGSYLVKYTAKDARNQVVGLARITVQAAASSKLAAAPITIFVRPQLDTTVDALAAVSNPAGRVLLVGSPTYTESGGSSLDVSVVDHHLLRVRGNTASGNPGLLGTLHYSISDGTDTSDGTVDGEATVMLLADPREQAPIAVDDTVTTRAGAQVDIPVLDNDIATNGSAMVLDPIGLKNPSHAGLAFVSGQDVRYLAPKKAGTYDLYYSVFSAGAPTATDTAKITVTVAPIGESTTPQPPALTGRVLAGESVSIPFDGYGIDADGDTVSLDRIVSQPVSGTATISADGTAIVYTSVVGFKGPVQFTYSVVDSRGNVARSTVDVGVLDAQSDPSPVTFSDYVEVRAGVKSQVTVYPASNDIDPTGKKLTLTKIVPDAQPGTPEYASLKALVGKHDGSEVKLTAGDSLGVKSYIYTVSDPTGNTSSGLVVMKVVSSAVPDIPQVADTYLTLADRASFATGVDVVTGKVSWTSGDVKNLTMSLYGSPAGIRVHGWKISGTLPAKTTLYPFRLSGKNNAGQLVSTYGFLRVPGRDDIILALAPGQPAQRVKQKGTVTFSMAKLLALPAGERIEVEAAKAFGTTGGRPDAGCSLVSGSTIEYHAGASAAPWDDSCTVPVKLVGQDQYTDLLVPIAVDPSDPVPELVSASLTAGPAGGQVSFPLSKMTLWRGTPNWAELVYTESYTGSQFDVSFSGKSITIEAHDDATPGKTEQVAIGLKTPSGVAPAVITLTVGPAPTTLPQGSTITQTCTVDQPCVADVVGGPNEVNDFKTPLRVVSVTPTSTCNGVSFAVHGTKSIGVSYADSVAGGQCQASFVVEDAQGRLSSGARDGSLTIDLHGYPQAPDSVQQVSYGDKSIGLQVAPGGATAAYPALSGFLIKQNGHTVAHCTPAGDCATITTQVNGDKEDYEAFAYNDVGNSQSSVGVTAWSYRAPTMGTATATPVYDSSVTTQNRGAVSVTMTTTDPTVRGYQVSGANGLVQATGTNTVTSVALDVGSRTISVTPVSQIDVPAGNGDTPNTQQLSVAVAGLPTISGNGSVASTASSLTLSGFSVGSNYSAKPIQTIYVAYTSGTPQCTVGPDGSGLGVGGLVGAQSTSPTIGGLATNVQYRVAECVSNGFGAQLSDSTSAITWQQPAAPTGWTYAVGDGSTSGVYAISLATRGAVPAGFSAVFNNFDDNSGTASRWGEDPEMSVKYCLNISSSMCSDSSEITATAANKSWQERVSVSGLSCNAGQNLAINVSSDGNIGSASVSSADYQVLGATQTGDGNVPLLASSVSNVSGTVSFGSNPNTAGLAAYAFHIDGPDDCR